MSPLPFGGCCCCFFRGRCERESQSMRTGCVGCGGRMARKLNFRAERLPRDKLIITSLPTHYKTTTVSLMTGSDRTSATQSDRLCTNCAVTPSTGKQQVSNMRLLHCLSTEISFSHSSPTTTAYPSCSSRNSRWIFHSHDAAHWNAHDDEANAKSPPSPCSAPSQPRHTCSTQALRLLRC